MDFPPVTRCARGALRQPAEGPVVGQRVAGGPPAAAHGAFGLGGRLPEPDAQRAEAAAAEHSHPGEREGAGMAMDQCQYM